MVSGAMKAISPARLGNEPLDRYAPVQHITQASTPRLAELTNQRSHVEVALLAQQPLSPRPCPGDEVAHVGQGLGRQTVDEAFHLRLLLRREILDLLYQ